MQEMGSPTASASFRQSMERLNAQCRETVVKVKSGHHIAPMPAYKESQRPAVAGTIKIKYQVYDSIEPVVPNGSVGSVNVDLLPLPFVDPSVVSKSPSVDSTAQSVVVPSTGEVGISSASGIYSITLTLSVTFVSYVCL